MVHNSAFIKTQRIVHNWVISAVCKFFKKRYEPGTKDGMQTMTTDLTVLQMTDSHTLGGGGGGETVSSGYGKGK